MVSKPYGFHAEIDNRSTTMFIITAVVDMREFSPMLVHFAAKLIDSLVV